MNSIQRRLFRAFAEAGGDLTEDAEVERFIRYVEGSLLLLPPKVKEATEFLWRDSSHAAYVEVSERLSVREGSPVSIASLRQRVSRGIRMLEDAIRQRHWNGQPHEVSRDRGGTPAHSASAGVQRSHYGGSVRR